MRAFLLACLLVVPHVASAAAPSARSATPHAVLGDATEAELDAYITHAMREWKQPGLSIVVVKDGRPVYMKGFGVRSIGGGRVGVDTKFGMMSTTKAMTALAIAMLVDEGKLAWDDPVQKTLPWFQMPDADFSRRVTVRDTLRHNAGLGGDSDMLWLSGAYSTRQLLERVPALTPAYAPYAGFGYSNVMYQVAGELVSAASGMPWDTFVQTRIIDPLGMSRSHATLGRMQAAHDPDVTLAHFEIDGTLRQIAEQPVDAVPAAGAAWTTARDAARWLQFLLAEGDAGGKRLVSEAGFRELFKPQVLAPADFYPTTQLTRPRWTSYGLGWFQQDYRGQFLAMHTGSIDGRTALVALVPDRELGIAVFGNADHVELRHALMLKVIDLDLGGATRDWSAELRALYAGFADQAAKARAERASRRVVGTRPTRPLAAYAGTYVHPAFGDLRVALDDGALVVGFGANPQMAGVLTHWHYDTFDMRLGDGRYPASSIRFELDDRGEVTAASIDSTTRFVRAAGPAAATATK
jgi:CubicO group peptidase (beta-lactamase class C family)